MPNKKARKFLVIMDIIIGLLLLFQLLMNDLDLKFLGSVIIINAFFLYYTRDREKDDSNG